MATVDTDGAFFHPRPVNLLMTTDAGADNGAHAIRSRIIIISDN